MKTYSAKKMAIRHTAAIAVFGLLFIGASCGGGGNTGGVLKTTDSAETWEVKNYVGANKNRIVTIDGLNISKLRIDASNPQTIYATTLENGIYKSDTGGDQWYATPLGSDIIRDLQINPKDTTELYATLNNQIIQSHDSGLTWESVYTDVQGSIINRIAIDWYNPNRVLAGTSLGTVLLTEDGGLNWRVAYDIVGQISDVVVSPHDSRLVYITELGTSVHRSEDGGITWKDLFNSTEKLNDRGFQDFLRSHLEVQNITGVFVDVNNGRHIFIATKYGLLSSSNAGDTWDDITTLITKQADQNLSIKNVTTVRNKPEILLFTVNNQIHKSVDYGVTWKTIDNFPSAKIINTIVEHPTDDSTFYAGVTNPPQKKKSILRPF